MNNSQGKVSMVVPCYNKELYIGAMLESVLNQVWDNIELILVNDGSTDKTKDVILSYIPKFNKRGYDVKIIDQENGGCCKAVHTGLINMTGEYYCLVDADDEIEPNYVSTMAGWLDENESYEWAACSFKPVKKVDNNISVGSGVKPQYSLDCDNLLTHYIFRKVITTVWVYVMRVSYLKKCGMIDNFCTLRSKTYEPLVMVPPAAMGGKLKYFDIPLYRYNMYASDLFGFDSIDKAKAYYDDYFKMYEWTIQRLKISNEKKQNYLNMARLSYHLELLKQLPNINRALANNIGNDISNLIKDISNIDISSFDYESTEYIQLFNALELQYLKKENSKYIVSPGKFDRIIGYGALGKSAGAVLPYLINTPYCPTEMWDNNYNGSIKKPDFTSLTKNDLVLVFPIKPAIVNEIKKALADCPATVFYKNDIEYILSEIKYPQLLEFEVK